MRASDRHQPQLGGAHRLQAVENFLPAQAFHQPHGRGPQRRVHRVAAQQRHAHMQRFVAEVQVKAHPVEPGRLDAVGPDVGLRVEPVGHHAGAGAVAHGQHQGVVGVEHRHALRRGRQGLHQLGLAARDGFEAAGPLQVNCVNVGHNAHMRTGQFRQELDLTGMVKTHLQNGALVRLGELEQHQRQTHFVLIIPFRFKGAIARAEHGGDQFLGGRLADAAGDPDHPGPEPAAPESGQDLHRLERILDPQTHGRFEPGHLRMSHRFS